MLRGSKFWESVEEAIQKSDKGNEARNSLLEIANAYMNLKEALKYLPTFLDNGGSDYKVSMNYYFYRGYLFSLNHYKDNPNTTKENVVIIDNLIKIGLLLPKMEDKVLNNKDVSIFSDKIKEGLETLINEVQKIFNQEIKKSSLVDILKNVQDKKGYLNNYLGITKTRRNDISEFILKELNASL